MIIGTTLKKMAYEGGLFHKSLFEGMDKKSTLWGGRKTRRKRKKRRKRKTKKRKKVRKTRKRR